MKTLLVVGFVASIALAIVGRQLYSMRREAAAVESLLQAGAKFRFDYQRGEDGVWRSQTPPPDPYGLNAYLGERFFAKAIVVRLSADNEAAAKQVELLPYLSELEQVALAGSGFDDESIEPLGRCEKLVDLSLESTHVTGDGLEKLANREGIEEFQYLTHEAPSTSDPLSRVDCLTNLKRLTVVYAPLTKSHGRAIGRLKKVELLELAGLTDLESGALESFANLDSAKTVVFGNASDVPLSDDELAALAEMESLEYLAFDGSHVTDEGIKRLAKLQRLRRLSAFLPQVTDEGMIALADVSTLEELYVAYSPITDASLDAFDRLPNLKALYVGATVSRERAARFAEAAPGREVWRFSGKDPRQYETFPSENVATPCPRSKETS